MKISKISEDETNVLIDTLIDYKNRGKLPPFGKYNTKNGRRYVSRIETPNVKVQFVLY